MEHQLVKTSVDWYGDGTSFQDVWVVCPQCGQTARREENLTADCPERKLSELAIDAIEDRLINFYDGGWLVRSSTAYEEDGSWSDLARDYYRYGILKEDDNNLYVSNYYLYEGEE